MQFSYRLLTMLYLSVTTTQAKLFPDKSEGGGGLLQSFGLGSSEFAPADLILHSFHRHQGLPSMSISPFQSISASDK